MSTRPKIVAGNWKMNTDLKSARQLAHDISQEEFSLGTPEGVTLILIPPFPFIYPAKEACLSKDGIHFGAQNIYQEADGAFTGEVSGEMLRSVGCEYVVIGHSERREYFHENSELLASKLDRALASGLHPILCVGERLDQREADESIAVVTGQLKAASFHLTDHFWKNMILAYEPVWAIGTGRTATPEQAQEVHAALRQALREQYGDGVAESTPILYGGSVKASNAAELFEQPDIDGALVGGASLKAKDFARIARAWEKG